MNGAAALVRSLRAQGAGCLFNLPGNGMFPLLSELSDRPSGLRYVTALNETCLAAMADGYGRGSRRASFVNVYQASGTALALYGAVTAWADRSPLVLMTTANSRRFAGQDMYAAVPRDITEVAAQFTKWSFTVPLASRIADAVARAVRVAEAAPAGPVHLAIPMDLYEEPVGDDVDIPARDAARTYGNPGPDPAGIEAACRLLSEARLPVILAGGEVALSTAQADIVSLAERLVAPVVGEPYAAYLGFPTAHPFFLGRLGSNRALVGQADVVLSVGAELTQPGWGAPLALPSTARIVQLTSDAAAVGKQHPVDLGLVGDVGAALRALAAELGQEAGTGARGVREQRRGLIARHREAYDARRRALLDAAGGPAGPAIRPVEVAAALEARLGNDAVLVNQGVTGGSYVAALRQTDDISSFYGLSARGSAQGWGLPAAIGIQLARPERRVVACLGDGGFMFTAQALWTAARFDVPVVAVVFDNRGWRDIRRLSRTLGMDLGSGEDALGYHFEPAIDYAGLARSLGVASRRVERRDDLAGALDWALAERRPALLDVVVDEGDEGTAA